MTTTNVCLSTTVHTLTHISLRFQLLNERIPVHQPSVKSRQFPLRILRTMKPRTDLLRYLQKSLREFSPMKKICMKLICLICRTMKTIWNTICLGLEWWLNFFVASIIIVRTKTFAILSVTEDKWELPSELWKPLDTYGFYLNFRGTKNLNF